MHLPRQSSIRMDLMPLTKTVFRASLALDTQHGVLLRGWLYIRTGHLVSCLRYDSIAESTARAFGRATTQSANETLLPTRVLPPYVDSSMQVRVVIHLCGSRYPS